MSVEIFEEIYRVSQELMILVLQGKYNVSRYYEPESRVKPFPVGTSMIEFLEETRNLIEDRFDKELFEKWWRSHQAGDEDAIWDLRPNLTTLYTPTFTLDMMGEGYDSEIWSATIEPSVEIVCKLLRAASKTKP